MGWGYGLEGGRDVGYGVPAWCDHPDCNEEIDRGLSFVCGGMHGGNGRGCGLYFCSDHLWMVDNDSDGMDHVCERCVEIGDDGQVTGQSFTPKPDHPDWITWKLTDESWVTWRADHPEAVAAMKATCHPVDSAGGTSKTATK